MGFNNHVRFNIPIGFNIPMRYNSLLGFDRAHARLWTIGGGLYASKKNLSLAYNPVENFSSAYDPSV